MISASRRASVAIAHDLYKIISYLADIANINPFVIALLAKPGLVFTITRG